MPQEARLFACKKSLPPTPDGREGRLVPPRTIVKNKAFQSDLGEMRLPHLTSTETVGPRLLVFYK